MGTTVAENETLLNALFGEIKCMKFMPSIPNLPYQYRLFINYEARSQRLHEWNEEIPRDFENVVTSSSRTVDSGAEAVVVGGILSFEEILERELAKEEARLQN